jgi:sterol 3beta-glucosyltransferase
VGLRAGKPAVPVPFFGDQPFWARRIYQLGAGSAPIPQKKLTADKLARALVEVTGNPAVIHKARELGEKIRAEDGVGNAVRFIENLPGFKKPAAVRK